MELLTMQFSLMLSLLVADLYCTVAIVVKALCYKPKGRGFDTR
jgi:hypothetical protein